MSSDLQSALQLLQTNNYVSLACVTAVVYDYFLTFSREVQFVWCRPWTWVSTIFVLVRYLGLCYALLGGLVGSTFVPGPVRVSVSGLNYGLPHYQHERRISKGTILNLTVVSAFEVFLNAADFVMLLRVYAMWNRSRKILWVLLLIYVPQVIFSFVFTGVYNFPNTHWSVTVGQILNFSFCNFSISETSAALYMYTTIPRFFLSATLLLLSVIQTLKQAIRMYRATKLWQPNRYMQQFVRDGILYFLVNVLFNITSIVQDRSMANSNLMMGLSLVSYTTISPSMPRFIISVRELYDRDLLRCWGGVDSGFGVVSQHIASQNAAVSAIAFADGPPEQDQPVEQDAHDSEVV